MKTFADKIIAFNRKLHFTLDIPGIEVMNPFHDPKALSLIEQFYMRFFNDQNKRIFVFGINPGRHGAGITGISFTDPIRLETKCRIINHLPKKPELSSEFIYNMIEGYGTVQEFYSKFFITAVSPLGFVSQGKNLNYYDTKELQEKAKPFIVQSIKDQLEFGAFRNCAICIGGDKNFRFLKELNSEHSFFSEIYALEHPRFIMQYRRKMVNDFINRYLSILKQCEDITRK
jgi:hypothetical protein